MSYAQTIIYSQDFENTGGVMPSEIDIIDGDNCDVPAPGTVYDFWTLEPRTSSGDTAMYVRSNFMQNPCTANDWLIFDTLATIPNTGNIFLKYGTYTTAATAYEIYVSTAGAAQSDFLANAAIFDTTGYHTQFTYVQDSISLNAYKGQQIYWAFRHITTNGVGFYIDDVQLIHHTIVGVNKTESSSFQCYPNPANTQLTVKLSSANEAVLRLYNALGQEAHQAMVQNGQLDMNTAQFVSGMYTISIQTGAQLQTERVLIQH